MRALSIRQPYAEEILRRIKKVEYRVHANGVRIGERFYIYAAMKWPDAGDIRRYCKRRWKEGQLPIGVLVGTARISKVAKAGKYFEWHLTDVKRLKRLRKPKKHAQPSWFNPF